MRTRNHAATAVALAVVVGLGLGGCSLLRGGGGELPAPTRSTEASATATPSASASGESEADLLRESASPRPPTPEPTEAAQPAPTMSTIPDGTVVAEGDVASPKGSIHFHYRIVADGEAFTAQWSGFTSTLPVPVSVMFVEIAPSVGDGTTFVGPGNTELGGATTGAAPTTSVLSGSGYDPSWLGTLVTYSTVPTDQEVPLELQNGKVLAVDTVRWSVPARTTNVHPVDGGARPNATGSVSATTASGAPASYVIAPDDLIGDVAARFGISVEALIWLNHDMRVYGQQQYLYEGTTLNLDPVRR